MTDVRETLADHARNALLVLGAALVLLGAVGPGPVGPVAVLGVVTLIAAFLLDEPIASLLRPDEDTGQPANDPVADLRERYVRGELEQAEFERRLERLLDPGDSEGASGPTGDRRDAEVLTGTAGSSGSSGRN